MELIDKNVLLKKLENLEASGGSKMYRKALNDALHYFFPKIIGELPTITPPPNDPLTLEELREMEKEPEPIYITGLGWKICYGIEDCFGRPALKVGVTARIYLDNYGEGFVAYRRKPERGTTCLKLPKVDGDSGKDSDWRAWIQSRFEGRQ